MKRYEADIKSGIQGACDVMSFVVATGQPSSHIIMEANAVGVELLTVRQKFSIGSCWKFNEEFLSESLNQVLEVDFLRGVREAKEPLEQHREYNLANKQKAEFEKLVSDWYEK